jgi:hypothetical protein
MLALFVKSIWHVFRSRAQTELELGASGVMWHHRVHCWQWRTGTRWEKVWVKWVEELHLKIWQVGKHIKSIYDSIWFTMKLFGYPTVKQTHILRPKWWHNYDLLLPKSGERQAQESYMSEPEWLLEMVKNCFLAGMFKVVDSSPVLGLFW